MDADDRYDSLFRYYWEVLGAKWGFAADPWADWRLLKAQARAESGLDPAARSPVGALGLLQLMPAVDLAADGKIDADNPEEAVREGLNHLGYLWKTFAEETGKERWLFALGAYNCGPGYVIEAQRMLAAQGLPTDQWTLIARTLPDVVYKGKRPDAAQTVGYVRGIAARFEAERG